MLKNRVEAGELLAQKLLKYKDQSVAILALPRGGVPVGFQVAKELEAPLDTVVVRKLGTSFNEEFGFGAIAPDGVIVLNEETVSSLGITQSQIDEVIEKEKAELQRRGERYKSGEYLKNKRFEIAILVDDGLATGVTAEAAIKFVRESYDPEVLVFAVPVSATDSARRIKALVDDLVCLETPPDFFAIGQWYEEFEQTSDQGVMEYLEEAKRLRLKENRDKK